MVLYGTVLVYLQVNYIKYSYFKFLTITWKLGKFLAKFLENLKICLGTFANSI